MVKIVEFFGRGKESEHEPIDWDVGEDLIVFMHNDDRFYRKYLYPKLLHIQTQVKAGKKVDTKILLPTINYALKLYTHRFDIKTDPKKLLSRREKLNIIKALLNKEKENFRSEYY